MSEENCCVECDYIDSDSNKCRDCKDMSNFKPRPQPSFYNPLSTVLQYGHTVTMIPTRDCYPTIRIIEPEDQGEHYYIPPKQIDINGEISIKSLRNFLTACLERQAKLKF